MFVVNIYFEIKNLYNSLHLGEIYFTCLLLFMNMLLYQFKHGMQEREYPGGL